MRRTKTIAISLLLGLGTTVLIGWIPSPRRIHTSSPQIVWSDQTHNWTCTPIHSARYDFYLFFPDEREDDEPIVLPSNEIPAWAFTLRDKRVVYTSGWPMRCFWLAGDSMFTVPDSWPFWSRLLIPIRPWVLPLAFNSAAWGTAWFFVLAGTGAIRRRRRVRRGHCAGCGYDLAGLQCESCPECGCDVPG